MVPTYGIVWCCFTVKGHRLWDGLLGGSANGPQIWDKCPGWVGVMPPKVTIYGSAACQEHERTPDMGHRAGMVRPDSPQRSPSMGCAACKEHERTPDMGRGAGMVRPDSPQRSPSMGCAPHGPPARGLLAAPRLGAAPPDPRGGGHPRPRRRRAGSPTPPVTRGIELCAALLFLLFFRTVVERGEDVEALPSCSDCACATAGA